MRLERAALALGSNGTCSERHQGWLLFTGIPPQDIHVFVFIEFFKITPPGTFCDSFPLPLHLFL
jgi:hypothetical protein